MSISDHYRSGSTERLLVTVITVDPANGRIEVVGKDAAVIQIGVGRVPPFFRWPQQGEYWTVTRENGVWGLGEVIESPDAVKSVRSLLAGEALVQAETIWTPSGEKVITSGQPAGGDLEGSYPDPTVRKATNGFDAYGITQVRGSPGSGGWGYINVKGTNGAVAGAGISFSPNDVAANSYEVWTNTDVPGRLRFYSGNLGDDVMAMYDNRLEILGSRVPVQSDFKVQYLLASGAEVQSIAYANPTSIELQGSTALLRPSITPAVNVWWEVEYNAIFLASDAAWVRTDQQVQLLDGSGAPISDVAGISIGAKYAQTGHNALSWQASWPKATFKLNAGSSYQARALSSPVNGTWTYWQGSMYLRATSKVVGFW